MYEFDFEVYDPSPEGPTDEEILQLQLNNQTLELKLNIIEDMIIMMKDMTLCYSVNCEGWNAESLLAAKKLSPFAAENKMALPSSCRNMNPAELEMCLEMDFVYNTVKFIKDVIKAIFTGVKEALIWFFNQFKPSTHYHAMLKSRKRKVLSDLKSLDTGAFKRTVILMESFEVTTQKVGAILLIYEELHKLFKNHTSILDDRSFSHREVFDAPLKLLGYYVDPVTHKITTSGYHAPLESRPLEDLGWSVNNIQLSVDRVILMYEKQSIVKDLTKRLEKLIDDTKETERRMKKVTDDYSKVTKEKDRILTVQKEILFLTSLGKVLINGSHRTAHQYLVLMDKIESLKRR